MTSDILRAILRAAGGPHEWASRLHMIPDYSLRCWVASILYWDFAGDESASVFLPLTESYNLDQTHTDAELLEALKAIGYPEPEYRVIGNYKPSNDD